MQYDSLNVALIQQSCVENKNINLSSTITKIRKAAEKGAKLIVLQELHTSLYFCQTEKSKHFDLAETIPGFSTDTLSDVAKELKVVIVASLFEKRATGLYHNTAVVLDSDGSIAGRYRKKHIPDDPGFYEKFYFTPGDLGFMPISTSIGRIGVLICWDQWFPEAARLMALAGADLLVYPTAIGWGSQESDEKEKQRQLEAWMTIQRSHAIANGIPVLVCNRVGFEAAEKNAAQGITFWGNSFVTGQQGEILANSETQEIILHATLDMTRNEKVRRGWPFLRDRRIDAYQDILLRYCDT